MGTTLGKLQMLHYNHNLPRIVNNADAIIVQNKQHRQFLQDRFDCSFPDFIHCGGGVDISRFREKGNKTSMDGLVIVYAGSLVEERGVKNLVGASKLLIYLALSFSL